MIKKENNQWCVYSSSGGKKLGCHATEAEAKAQLAAVEASKAQDRREVDINGYWSIPDNPISKVGVFPYRGAEIGAPDPDRIYNVYRPAEELGDPATLASFNLIPMIDEHEFLGVGGTPAEQKGVQGTTGEGASFDYPYLKNGLRVYSSFMQDLILAGKTELSPAYRCDYDFTPGVFEGQQYDAVQRNIRGNHLALVARGRTGPDVAVMDSYLITCDSAEYIMTPEMIEQIKALIAQVLAEQAAGASGDETPNDDPNKPTDELPDPSEVETPAEAATAVAEAVQTIAEVKEALAEAEAAVAEAEGEKMEDAMPKLKKAMDGLLVTRVRTKAPVAKPAKALDAATVIQQIEARDSMVKRLTPHVGTFDTAGMLTANDVAKYGIQKLNIKAADGAELAVLEGYLQAVKPDAIVQDSAPVRAGDTASKLWKE